MIKAKYCTFPDIYDRVSASSASWCEKRTQLKTTLFPGLLSPREEVEFLIRLVPVLVFAPVSSKRTAEPQYFEIFCVPRVNDHLLASLKHLPPPPPKFLLNNNQSSKI